MIEMTVTEFSRNLSTIFDRIEYKHEEIILIRHNHIDTVIIPSLLIALDKEKAHDVHLPSYLIICSCLVNIKRKSACWTITNTCSTMDAFGFSFGE